MGSRYNVAHIPEATVKEAWANYSKWDYYYTTELEKGQEQLKSVLSSAEARLTAKGVMKGSRMYQQEMDRITNIASADFERLKSGHQSLKTGAIKSLLTEAPISKFSKGNYGAYIRHYDSVVQAAEDQLGHLKNARLENNKYYRVSGYALKDYAGSPNQRGGILFATGLDPSDTTIKPYVEHEVVSDSELSPRSQYKSRRVSAEEHSRLVAEAEGYLQNAQEYRSKAMGFEEYYANVFGAYDPRIDQRAVAMEESEKEARGKAGSRSYKVQAQPKGQPGGGKPGNPFMQTGQEIAKEKAPTSDQEKAWWM